MCAKLAFANRDSPRRCPVPRFRFARSANRMDMTDAKVALDVVIRPSLQLWRIAPVLGRDVLTSFKRPRKPTISGDHTSSASSITLKKKVRFNEQPVTISRKGFFGRCRKDSISPPSSPARSCLVIREYDQPGSPNPSEPSPEMDCMSIYEDCLSEHPSFVVDIHVLERDDNWDARSLRRIRRSDFYEMESGIATFDRAGYASYCLSRWLDKQREEARDSRKPVFRHTALIPCPSRTLSPPAPTNISPVPRPTPPVVTAPTSCRPSRSLPRQMWRCIEDELQNAVVVLIIGLLIHIFLFVFLVYDIFTRGFIPSDD